MRLPTICEKTGLKRGKWAAEEDAILSSYVKRNGHENWVKLSKYAGLNRSGKSCRLRWLNYLRPDLKKGNFTPEEEERVHNLHAQCGNSWSRIAASLPGRSDNEIKNYWHTKRKNRSESKKATPKPISAAKYSVTGDSSPIILETSRIGLVGIAADEKNLEGDLNVWPDLLQIITSLPMQHDDNAIASDPKFQPDENITSVMDFPISPQKPGVFFSPFVADGEVLIPKNQPVEETQMFAETDLEDENYWNEMLLLSQDLDIAFVLAEAPPLPEVAASSSG